VALLAATLTPVSAGAQAVVGSTAPLFTATDSHGQTHALERNQYSYTQGRGESLC